MIKRLVLNSTVVGAAFCLFVASPASAQEPTRIKQHNAWGAYTYAGASGKICYVLSIPEQKEPADRDHGDVFFMIARHPGNQGNLEPQFKVGYPFKEESKVTLTIDGKNFAMYTEGDSAWIEDPANESVVVEAMKAGSKMSLSAQSRRGTETKYAYSLSGVTASLNDIASCQ